MTTNTSQLRLLVLEGDGIGPEIMAATLRVLQAAERAFGLKLAFEPAQVGLAALSAQGTTLPDQVVEMAKAADGVLLGPVTTHDYPPRAQGGRNPSGELRKTLDLYANIRPARSRRAFHRAAASRSISSSCARTPKASTPTATCSGSGEFMPTPDLALAVRKISRSGSMRIAEAAFRIAMHAPRKKVTAVHKANVLASAEGLFLECVRAVATRYPRCRL